MTDAATQVSRLAAMLTSVAKRRTTLTYLEAARALDLPQPQSIHRLTEVLETLMRHQAAAGEPQLASLVVSRVRGGLPAPGFFQLLGELGLYSSDPAGPDAKAYVTSEQQRCFSAASQSPE